MELRAAVGLQRHGGFSGWSSILAPRLGSLRLWGNSRFKGGRGGRGGVLTCSSGADAGRLIDGRDLNEDFDFWEYEASQHSEAENFQDVEVETSPPHVRPEFVVPRVKFTRESKGLKPTYRVFSRDRQTSPKPRVNPYSVLMKMIDPANDDEYLDSDSNLDCVAHDVGSTGLEEDGESVAYDMDSTGLDEDGESVAHVMDFTSLVEVGESGAHDMDSAGFEEDFESVAHVMGSTSLEDGESVVHVMDPTALEEGFDISLKTDNVFGIVPSFAMTANSDSQDGDQGLPFTTDEEKDINVGVRLSDIWSDLEDDDLDHFDDEEEHVEEASDGEDPLRRFLRTRSGNSKQEGRVFKFNKRAKKLDTNTSVLVVPEKKVVVNPISANQTETSAMREVLQIAYNLPKNRALEDYMAPFAHKFSSLQANLILEALCGDELTDQVLSFFRWMRSHELGSSRSFSLLFAFLGRMGMPDEALSEFATMPEERQFHSVEVYNALITCLANCSRQDEVPSILSKMQESGNEPDAVTFSILMNSATKTKQSLHEVWSLYQDMVTRGVTPSATIFGTLIKAFCEKGLLKEALLITTEMEKLNIPVNVVIYNTLINAYGRAGRMEEAEGLVAEMRERGVTPNVGTYNTLISGYLEANQVAVAEELVKEMESSGLHPDVVTFTALLGASGAERAAQVFHQMESRGVRPNSLSYTALIASYAAGGWPEKASKAFEMMERRGVRPTVESFTALLDAYRRAGDMEMVEKVWRRMKKEGCAASRITYMTVLDAFQKQGRYKEVRDLVEEFRNRGLKPDLMVYNMLLNAYMRGGRHFKAPEILREMKEAGFQPDSFTYCTLIYGYLRVRDHTMALKYRREMMDRRQLPDAKTYAKLRAILKVVEGRRDVNDYKSRKGHLSKPLKKGCEKAKSYWKRDR